MHIRNVIVGSYRSVGGSYDNEGVAIFALIFTFYLWVRSVHTGSMLWSCACAISYYYMVAAWGGYVFIINIIPIYVLVMLAAGRCVRVCTVYMKIITCNFISNTSVKVFLKVVHCLFSVLLTGIINGHDGL